MGVCAEFLGQGALLLSKGVYYKDRTKSLIVHLSFDRIHLIIQQFSLLKYLY